MPTRYAEELDTKTTFSKDSAPERDAKQDTPNTYAEQVLSVTNKDFAFRIFAAVPCEELFEPFRTSRRPGNTLYVGIAS